MSDRTRETPDDATPATAAPDPVDHSRRKLTGAALGASAIFTLASRPVWANQCSISGMASGNLSAPKVTCHGCTPGYWKECQHLDSWAVTGYSPTQSFNQVFGTTRYKDCNGTDYTLLDVLCLNGGRYSCFGSKKNKPANPGGAPASCTTGAAFNDLGGDPVYPNLGFHAVAALLNAAHPDVNYGYDPEDIKILFRDNQHRPGELKDSLAMLNERECPLN
jgi:hypothetical protein